MTAARWTIHHIDEDRLHDFMAKRAAALGDPWYVLTPHEFYSGSFRSHAEAVAYVLRQSVDPNAELWAEVGR